MIKTVLLCLFIIAGFNLTAQDDTLGERKILNPLMQNLSLQHNKIYYKKTRMAKEDLLILIDKSIMDSTTREMTKNDFSKFYKYKSLKSGFPIVASFTLLIGLIFTANSIIHGPDGRVGNVVAASVFGGVGIGFTSASIINAVKFRKIKSKLSKNYFH